MRHPTLSRRGHRLDALAASARSGVDGAGPSGRSLHRLRHDPMAVVGGLMVASILLLALCAQWLMPKDPYLRYPELIAGLRADAVPGPRPGFPLGSDELGRDLLSRLILASQESLLIGLVATLSSFVVGALLGAVAAMFGGWVDTVVMRVVDALLCLPGLFLAISVAALVERPNRWTVIAAVAAVAVPVFARLLRGSLLVQREAGYVLGARAIGVRSRTIMLRHLLPNSLTPMIVQATITFPLTIIEAAGLSFLGLGDQHPDRPEWGAMLGAAQPYLDSRPGLLLYPAAAIALVGVAFGLLAEGLRVALQPGGRP